MPNPDITSKWKMDSTQFHQGLRKATEGVESFASSAKTSFAAVRSAIAAAGIAGSISSIVDKYAELSNFSARLGVSTDDLQRFGVVAARARVPLEDVVDFVNELNVKAFDAARGSKEMAQHFATLGIDVNKFINSGANEQFQVFLDAFSKISGTSQGRSIIDALASDVGTRLLPALNDAKKVIQEMADITIVDEEDIQAIAALAKAKKDFEKTTAPILAKLVSQFATSLRGRPGREEISGIKDEDLTEDQKKLADQIVSQFPFRRGPTKEEQALFQQIITGTLAPKDKSSVSLDDPSPSISSDMIAANLRPRGRGIDRMEIELDRLESLRAKSLTSTTLAGSRASDALLQKIDELKEEMKMTRKEQRAQNTDAPPIRRIH